MKHSPSQVNRHYQNSSGAAGDQITDLSSANALRKSSEGLGFSKLFYAFLFATVIGTSQFYFETIKKPDR